MKDEGGREEKREKKLEFEFSKRADFCKHL